MLTALTSTARATNTIWFAAQDTPKPRYQPDTNHPAPAVNAAYKAVEASADFCRRSPHILPAAKETRSASEEETARRPLTSLVLHKASDVHNSDDSKAPLCCAYPP